MTAPLWSMDLSMGPGPCSCGHLSVPPSLSDHLHRTQVTVHNHLLPELELQLPRPGVEGEGQLVSRSRAPSAPLPSPLLIIHSPSPRSPPSWNLRSQPESIRHAGNLRPRKKVRPLPGIENRAGVIAVPCHLCQRPRPQPVRPTPTSHGNPLLKGHPTCAQEGLFPGRAEAQVAGLGTNCSSHVMKETTAQNSRGAGSSPAAGVSLSPRHRAETTRPPCENLEGSKTDICLWDADWSPS